MYILNGIVYGDNPMDSVEVTGVKPLDDMIMLLTFSNGETRVFDATILEGEAFEPLKDADVFKHPVIEYGVVTWLDGEIDCAPEYMYNHSYKYDVMAV